MITIDKNYTKKPHKKQSVPHDKWQKQSYADKITLRSIRIHTHKKKKEKKIIYIHKEESNQISKQIYQ